jgi:hypothetical protein
MGRLLRAEPERARQHVGLEDRLDDQLEGRLHDAVADRGNRQRPLLGRPGLGDPHPACRQRPPTTPLQALGELVEQPVNAEQLDLLDGQPVDAGRAAVAAHQLPRPLQDVSAVDLVVERMKPSPRVGLGRPVQRSLQFSDLVLLGGASHEVALTGLPLHVTRGRSSGPSHHLWLCCPPGSTGTTAASDALPAHRPLPGSPPVIEQRLAGRIPQPTGPGRASPVPAATFCTFRALYAGEFLGAALQALHPVHGLRPEGPGSALPCPHLAAGHTNDGAGFA